MGCFALEAHGTGIQCARFFRSEALNLKNGYIEGTNDVENVLWLSGGFGLSGCLRGLDLSTYSS